MAYNGSSPYYGIPIAIDGDELTQEDNIQQINMVDWVIQAATSVVDNGVIAEGNFTLGDDLGAGYSVLLNPVGGVGIKGVLRRGLAYTASTVSWGGLSTGNFYYLYLKYTTTLYTDSTSFDVVSLTSPVSLDNTNYLYIATYDLTGGYPGTLNSNPEGKNYTSSVLTHINQTVDPHSSTLTQTNLVVSGSLQVGLDVGNSLAITQSDISSTQPLLTLTHANPLASSIKATNEFILEDVRMSTQLSETGETDFDNGKESIVGAINKNTADIGTNISAISLNTIHRTSNGTDHSNVVLNNTHRTSDGTDHSDVVLNNTHRGSAGIDHSDVVLNNAHRVNTSNPHNVTAAQTAQSNDWTSPPTGSTVGEMNFDTTLGRPYWWDGSQWVDCDGNPHA